MTLKQKLTALTTIGRLTLQKGTVNPYWALLEMGWIDSFRQEGKTIEEVVDGLYETAKERGVIE